jgi:hypothetical protein
MKLTAEICFCILRSLSDRNRPSLLRRVSRAQITKVIFALVRSVARRGSCIFTVTSTGATQATGSPHAITGPQYIAVLPK